MREVQVVRERFEIAVARQVRCEELQVANCTKKVKNRTADERLTDRPIGRLENATRGTPKQLEAIGIEK